MKKTTLLLAFFLGGMNTMIAQAVFRHVTSAANTGHAAGTRAHITVLNHPRLNGNPSALIFILPNYNLNGADATGADYTQNAGVWYNGSRWTIFNQDTTAAMPLGMTFNVLVAPPGNPNCFPVTCTAASKAGLPNGMVIDHPASNGKTNAMLLVTQNRANVYNDASQIVTYSGGKWYISNNGYMAYWRGDTKDTRCLMPEGSRFNVMVIENGQAPGFPDARAFQHTATKANISNPHITFLDQPGLSGNRDAILLATAYWGHGDADRTGPHQAGGPYNEGPLVAWYDHPSDPWKYRDNAWSLYNGNSAQMPEGAKVFVVAANANAAQSIPNLTGFYTADNGGCGQAYIRQIGNNIYWFGEHPNGSFGHVFSGTISGNTITGSLWDVPKGNLLSRGNCVYTVSADGNTLTRTSGSIGCNILVKGALPAALPASRPMQPGSGALTGVWDCNDGASTYVREDGSNFVFFSEAKNNGTRPGFANIYVGTRNGNTITGTWVDVPKGTHLGNGAMTLRVENDTRFVRADAGNGYGGSVWTRSSDSNDPRYWNFELGNINGWIKESNAFDGQPNAENARLRLPETWSRSVPLGGSYWRNLVAMFPYFNGYQGRYWVSSLNLSANDTYTSEEVPGESPVGRLFSKEFTISTRYISYLVSGISPRKLCSIQLLLLDDGSIQKEYSYQGFEYRLVGNDRIRVPVTRKATLPTYSIDGKNYVAYYSGTVSILDVLRNQEVDINNLIAKDALTSDFFTRQHFAIPAGLQGKKARIAVIDADDEGHINVDDIRFENTLSPQVSTPQPALPLWGFVDMHTHPLSNLAFGTELFYGAPYGNINQALENCNGYHGGPGLFDNRQGNEFRRNLVDQTENWIKSGPYGFDWDHKREGAPLFVAWPKWHSVLHQQMWIDWIKRARDGGLRVMVALATHSHAIADGAETKGPYDDLPVMNNIIAGIKDMVRSSDFMEIAYSPADLRRIVSQGKLAVIIGTEMDNLGNFYRPAEPRHGPYYPDPGEQQIKNEIDRLFNEGVRYILPIHLTNNVFGGAAIYNSMFNIANKYNTGTEFTPEVVDSVTTGISFCLQHPVIETNPESEVIPEFVLWLAGGILPSSINPSTRENYTFWEDTRGQGKGHRNILGLTEKGKMAVKYMMSKGIMIDVDHMSEKAVDDAFSVASEVPGGYPVNSGHNGYRGTSGNENSRTARQIDYIVQSGGLLGSGHGGTAKEYVTHGSKSPGNFIKNYREYYSMSKGKQLAFGTDVNGFYPMPEPPTAQSRITYGVTAGAEQMIACTTLSKTWNYNLEGVAHYGLMPDFLQSTKKAGLRAKELGTLFLGAEYFAQMWEKCERQKSQVR